MMRILRLQLRRDRLTLPIWIIGTALLLTATATSVQSTYGDAADRRGVLTVALASPTLLALRGIPNGDSIGSAVHFQGFAFLAVTIGLMNTFLATRHGRADEERGRRELLLATPLARLAPPIATLVLGIVANAAFAVLAVAGYTSAGLPLDGAALSAAALALTGLAFLGLGMLAGELTATSRAANGVGVAIVLAAYALRAAGDATGTPDFERLTLAPGWQSALSPIGWGQQTLAFTDDRGWPLAALGALALVGAAVALAVHARRDLGASLLAERRGRAAGRATLRGSLGLAWRLQWPTALAWTVGAALLGLALGSLVTAIADAQSSFDSPALTAVLQSLGHTDGSDLAAALTPALMNIVGALAGAAGVQAVLRMRDEESEGRLEQVLAGPRSRAGWLAAFTLVATATVVLLLTATGAAAALGFVTTGDADSAGLAFGQALVQAPAALVFTALAALLVGLLPRAAVALSWGLYGLGVVVGLFGGLLDLPDSVEHVSPLRNVPVLPTDDVVPTLIVAAVAAAAVALAALAIRRRDLQP